MSPSQKKISRRKFIATTGCAALGCTTLFSSLISMKAIASAAIDKRPFAPPPGDYRALVCILLSGGADSHNILIPQGPAEYQEYELTRSNLAIPRNDLLTLNHNGQQGRKYGLHPQMPEVQSLFNDGKAAFLANVGTLLEPTTKDQFKAGGHPLPLGLFSHSDQAMHWQTGRPGDRNAKGWGGRIADLVQSQNTNQLMSMNISLAGRNQFQNGQNSIEFSIRPNGNTGIYGYDQDNTFHELRNAAIDSMLERDYQDVFEKTYVNTLKNSKDGSVQFQEAIENLAEMDTVFSESDLSARLKMIAKIIAVREELGFSRQTFFVSYGGWDNHDMVLESQEKKLPVLSKALSEFNSALEELSVSDKVATFTVSDFGRTLTSNGNGSDHAWGGNMMVTGGSVNGGQIYGNYPSMEVDSEYMLNRGRFIPTLSAAEYLGELALWFGVSPSDVGDILPDLQNFHDLGSSAFPIGFMNPIV